MEGAALRVADPEAARCPPVRRGERRDVRGGRHRRLQDHHDPRLGHAAEGREVAPRVDPDHSSQEPDRGLGAARDPQGGVRLAREPSRREHPQRRGGRHGLPNGPGPRLRRQRRLLPRGHDEVPAPVRRPVGRLPAARVGHQAVELHRGHRRPRPDRLHDVHGRRHRLRPEGQRLVPADAGGRSRARSEPAPPGARSSRSTSRRSRPGSRSGWSASSTAGRSSACTTRRTPFPWSRKPSARSRRIRSICSGPTAPSPMPAS